MFMYLCRSFDQLNHGQEYESAKPAVHIGLLDYSLFIGQPEFYASYKLINVKSHQTYSDGLTLNVLDLTRIDLATEEDKKYNIHEWARLFKATTWEEIKMPEYKDTLRCRLYKDHKKLYEDLVHFEGMLELVKIEFRRILRECTTTIEIRDAQIQQLRAEIEALKAQN